MTYKKTHPLHLNILLTISILIASKISFAEVVEIHDFPSEINTYSAFPNLYRSKQENTIITYTSRNIASHHNSTGKNYYFSSNNCGTSWNPDTRQEAPSSAFSRENGYYEGISVGSWVELKPGETRTDDPFISSEYGKRYIAKNAFEKKSLDGQTWESHLANTPRHALLMNYNAASQIKTSTDVNITALYYKEFKNSKSQVLIAKKKSNWENWKFIPIPLSEKWPNLGFNETALLELKNGNVAAFMRPDPDSLGYQFISISDDEGETWSQPEKTEISGFPASAILSEDKAIITTGNRFTNPSTIDAFVLDGTSLKVSKKINLDSVKITNKSDFGYPITLKCNNTFITSFYTPNKEGVVISRVISWRLN